MEKTRGLTYIMAKDFQEGGAVAEAISNKLEMPFSRVLGLGGAHLKGEISSSSSLARTHFVVGGFLEFIVDSPLIL